MQPDWTTYATYEGDFPLATIVYVATAGATYGGSDDPERPRVQVVVVPN